VETETKPKAEEITVRQTVKDNWNKTDELCSCCGAVTKRVRGITKQNLKRLLKPKFDVNELLITFVIIMVLVLAWAYNNETKQCRDWIKPMFSGDKENCIRTCNYQCELIQGIRNETQYENTMPIILGGGNNTMVLEK